MPFATGRVSLRWRRMCPLSVARVVRLRDEGIERVRDEVPAILPRIFLSSRCTHLHNPTLVLLVELLGLADVGTKTAARSRQVGRIGDCASSGGQIVIKQ